MPFFSSSSPLLFQNLKNLKAIDFHHAELKNQDLLSLPVSVEFLGFQESNFVDDIEDVTINRLSNLRHLILHNSSSIKFKSNHILQVDKLTIIDHKNDPEDLKNLLQKFANVRILKIQNSLLEFPKFKVNGSLYFNDLERIDLTGNKLMKIDDNLLKDIMNSNVSWINLAENVDCFHFSKRYQKVVCEGPEDKTSSGSLVLVTSILLVILVFI